MNLKEVGIRRFQRERERCAAMVKARSCLGREKEKYGFAILSVNVFLSSLGPIVAIICINNELYPCFLFLQRRNVFILMKEERQTNEQRKFQFFFFFKSKILIG